MQGRQCPCVSNDKGHDCISKQCLSSQAWKQGTTSTGDCQARHAILPNTRPAPIWMSNLSTSPLADFRLTNMLASYPCI